MAKAHITLTPVARSIPFDNSTNGFTTNRVQEAIEEARQDALDASRGPTIAAFDGTAGTGRWLEFFSNNPSNTNPFILAENAQLIAISIVTSSATATGTVTLYRNGVSFQTITLTAQKKNRVALLTHSLPALSELSLQVTSGSIPRATVFMFIRTVP